MIRRLALVVVLILGLTVLTAACKPQPTAADVALVDRIIASLQADKALKGMKVDVNVEEAVVTLTGHVRRGYDRRKVYNIVVSTPGVKKVENFIKIKPVKFKYIKVPAHKMIGGPKSK